MVGMPLGKASDFRKTLRQLLERLAPERIRLTFVVVFSILGHAKDGETQSTAARIGVAAFAVAMILPAIRAWQIRAVVDDEQIRIHNFFRNYRLAWDQVKSAEISGRVLPLVRDIRRMGSAAIDLAETGRYGR